MVKEPKGGLGRPAFSFEIGEGGGRRRGHEEGERGDSDASGDGRNGVVSRGVRRIRELYRREKC